MNFLHDVRFALRLHARSPGFTATLLAVLVVGIGATTAMFSLVMGLAFRPLPFEAPDELHMLSLRQPHVDPSPTSLADYLDWREEKAPFVKMAAIEDQEFSLAGAESPRPTFVRGANVSGEFFEVFALRALLGRLLAPQDDRIGGSPVVVISADLWRDRFANAPDVVGRLVTLNGRQYTIVGVAPEGFRIGSTRKFASGSTAIWTPLAVTKSTYTEQMRDHTHFLEVVARRAPGVTKVEAQARMDAIAKTLEERYPGSNANVGVRVRDLKAAIVGRTENAWILFAAVGLVFLVICANVANLLLARAATRRSEMAARAALGATRSRLVLQMLTETCVLFAFGGLGGTLLAHALVGVFGGQIAGSASAILGIDVDRSALAFALGVSFLFGVVFGLVPAVAASGVAPHAVLKETAARASLGRAARLARSALVIAQVALAFALLAGAGITLRAYLTTLATPMGFDTESTATARLVLPPERYASDERFLAFHRDLLTRVQAMPTVVAATTNCSMPLGDGGWNGSFEIEGRAPWARGSAPILERNVVGPNYFTTLRIPILRGRDFAASDDARGRLVVIIDQKMADTFFPGEDPVGKRLDLGGAPTIAEPWGRNVSKGEHPWREIIGVVGDVRLWGPSSGLRAGAYLPMAQFPMRKFTLAVRATDADLILRELPAVVAGLDPEQAIAKPALMTQRVATMLAPEHFLTTLLVTFSLVALVLAAFGVFGLVSYATSQRTREIGIRMALGATPEGVVRAVLGDGLRLVALGLVVGGIAAAAVSRIIVAHVAGATAFDPLVFTLIPGILLGSGALASLLPALRAARIPPATALRYE